VVSSCLTKGFEYGPIGPFEAKPERIPDQFAVLDWFFVLVDQARDDVHPLSLPAAQSCRRALERSHRSIPDTDRFLLVIRIDRFEFLKDCSARSCCAPLLTRIWSPALSNHRIPRNWGNRNSYKSIYLTLHRDIYVFDKE
jgi:hypothetical protein